MVPTTTLSSSSSSSSSSSFPFTMAIGPFASTLHQGRQRCGVSSGTSVPFPQRHCCHLSREILKRLSLENETRNGSTWVKPCLALKQNTT
jgi:hypothetical protein